MREKKVHEELERLAAKMRENTRDIQMLVVSYVREERPVDDLGLAIKDVVFKTMINESAKRIEREVFYFLQIIAKDKAISEKRVLKRRNSKINL